MVTILISPNRYFPPYRRVFVFQRQTRVAIIWLLGLRVPTAVRADKECKCRAFNSFYGNNFSAFVYR